MNSDKKLSYILAIISTVIPFLLLFLPFSNVRIVLAICLIIISAVTCYFVKKRNIPSINTRQVIMLMSVIGLLYLMIFYLSGIKFGFSKSTYQLSFTTLYKLIIPSTIIIILSEILRNVFLSQKNKAVPIINFFSCIFIDILLFSSLSNIVSFNNFMDLLGLTFIPSVTSNLLYHYLAKRYGIYPNIIFRLLITLYPYLIPVVPATPDSLVAFCKLIIPLIIYYYIDSLFEKKRKYATKRKSKWSYVGNTIFFSLMIAFIMLISCQFKYGMIVIATDSMTGEINKGDAVIYERYDDQIILEGDIIVFERNNNKIVHRVVDIKKINNQNRYYTKGDANDALDEGYVIDEQIMGVTDLKVSYIGYPTIWVRSLF